MLGGPPVSRLLRFWRAVGLDLVLLEDFTVEIICWQGQGGEKTRVGTHSWWKLVAHTPGPWHKHQGLGVAVVGDLNRKCVFCGEVIGTWALEKSHVFARLSRM